MKAAESNHDGLSRRQAIGLGLRGASVAALWIQAGGRSWAALARPATWAPADEARLNVVGDTILPATAGSPGAGAVEIGRFIVFMLETCQPPAVAEVVRTVLRDLDLAAQQTAGAEFALLDPARREALLVRFEQTAAARTHRGAVNGFRVIKELTLLGYFTSEPGATQALRYDPVPGAYRGSLKLGANDRSWAT
jgi:hypothetical protein